MLHRTLINSELLFREADTRAVNFHDPQSRSRNGGETELTGLVTLMCVFEYFLLRFSLCDITIHSYLSIGYHMACAVSP